MTARDTDPMPTTIGTMRTAGLRDFGRDLASWRDQRLTSETLEHGVDQHAPAGLVPLVSAAGLPRSLGSGPSMPVVARRLTGRPSAGAATGFSSLGGDAEWGGGGRATDPQPVTETTVPSGSSGSTADLPAPPSAVPPPPARPVLPLVPVADLRPVPLPTVVTPSPAADPSDRSVDPLDVGIAPSVPPRAVRAMDSPAPATRAEVYGPAPVAARPVRSTDRPAIEEAFEAAPVVSRSLGPEPSGADAPITAGRSSRSEGGSVGSPTIGRPGLPEPGAGPLTRAGLGSHPGRTAPLVVQRSLAGTGLVAPPAAMGAAAGVPVAPPRYRDIGPVVTTAGPLGGADAMGVPDLGQSLNRWSGPSAGMEPRRSTEPAVAGDTASFHPGASHPGASDVAPGLVAPAIAPPPVLRRLASTSVAAVAPTPAPAPPATPSFGEDSLLSLGIMPALAQFDASPSGERAAASGGADRPAAGDPSARRDDPRSPGATSGARPSDVDHGGRPRPDRAPVRPLPSAVVVDRRVAATVSTPAAATRPSSVRPPSASTAASPSAPAAVSPSAPAVVSTSASAAASPSAPAAAAVSTDVPTAGSTTVPSGGHPTAAGSVPGVRPSAAASATPGHGVSVSAPAAMPPGSVAGSTRVLASDVLPTAPGGITLPSHDAPVIDRRSDDGIGVGGPSIAGLPVAPSPRRSVGLGADPLAAPPSPSPSPLLSSHRPAVPTGAMGPHPPIEAPTPSTPGSAVGAMFGAAIGAGSPGPVQRRLLATDPGDRPLARAGERGVSRGAALDPAGPNEGSDGFSIGRAACSSAGSNGGDAASSSAGSNGADVSSPVPPIPRVDSVDLQAPEESSAAEPARLDRSPDRFPSSPISGAGPVVPLPVARRLGVPSPIPPSAGLAGPIGGHAPSRSTVLGTPLPPRSPGSRDVSAQEGHLPSRSAGSSSSSSSSGSSGSAGDSGVAATELPVQRRMGVGPALTATAGHALHRVGLPLAGDHSTLGTVPGRPSASEPWQSGRTAPTPRPTSAAGEVTGEASPPAPAAATHARHPDAHRADRQRSEDRLGDQRHREAALRHERGSSGDQGAAAPPPDLDTQARLLWPRLRAMLLHELRIDRERSGHLRDTYR